MERIANASVAALTARLVTQMTKDGYSPSATENVILLAAQLSDFMEVRAVVTYDEQAGEAFLEDRSRHVAKTALKTMKIFIARLNATFRGEGFLICMKRATPESLPEGLESLLSRYVCECKNHALRVSSIEKYEQIRRYLIWRRIDKRLDSHVFFSRTHEHMKISCVEEIFKKHLKEAKRRNPSMFLEKRYTPHTMRHTTAMHMLEAGVPLMSIKNFLGHAYLSSTERYAQLTQGTVDKHIREWNQRWFGEAHSTVKPVERKDNTPDFLK